MKKFVRFTALFLLIAVWIFSGWPSFNLTTSDVVRFRFPPPVEKARADFSGNTVIFITSTASTTWAVPSDWNNASNTIEVIGGGGGGRTATNGVAGGGGGAYAKISNLTGLTPGGSVNIQVGTGSVAEASGGDTWFNDTDATSTTCGNQSVCAKGGTAGNNDTSAGTGGASSTSIGDLRYKGGDSRNSGGTTGDAGSGGGGAAGPNGDGANGGIGSNASIAGGGGGGGNGGGATGTDGSGDGGAGGDSCGAACNGTAGDGGNGGSGGAAGTAGVTGGGGGGGDDAAAGGDGGNGAEWDSTHGSGGGGGGVGDCGTILGGDGGLYGGGGAGGCTGGTGAQGIIVITYSPASTYEQSAYKWYANQNSSTVGAELTSGTQDASTTLAATGNAFRLRLLLHVGAATSSIGLNTFKLQYASTTPGNCGPAFYNNSAFVDVATSTGEVRYNNNALPADGDLVVSTSTDLTHGGDSRVNQTYVEQNNFTVTSTVSAGADGKWDFSLIDAAAPGSATYCFRVVESDGTLIATSTSSKIPEIKTAAAANSAPTVASVVLNGGSAITLTPNATTSFNISYTITDTNGCADINTNKTTSTAFRSGVSAACAVPGPTTSNLNCYLYVTRATSTCSGNSVNATDTVQIYYFAQATDSSSSFPTDNWTAYALAVDAANATGSATSSAVELNTLLAINVTPTTTAYGTLAPGADTGSTNQTSTVQNAGNASTTLQVSGTALILGSNQIATSSQHYATSSFTFGGFEQVLSDVATAVTGFFLTSPTSTTAVERSTFWGITIPAGNPIGTYTGTNIFTAVFAP